MKWLAKWSAFLLGMVFCGVVLAQSTYMPMVPARLMDTRPGGTTMDGQYAGTGPIASTSTVNLTVLGRAGIPSSGVTAVALNVTVTDPTNYGYITLWPAGQAQPLAANLNLKPGQSISNQVIAKIGTNGQISIYVLSVNGSANVVVDVAGYFPTTSDLKPLTPARLMDTRSGGTTIDGQFAGVGAVSAGGTLDMTVLGRGGVPASGVSAIIVNITAVNPTSNSFITVWPSGISRPLAANLNVVAAQTIPNLVIVAPGSNGKISFYNNLGTTDLVVDVAGYFSATSTFSSVVPARLLDTRSGAPTIDGQYSGQGAIAGGGTLNFTVLGRGNVPTTGVGAVALNIVSVLPPAGGYLVAWGTGTTAGNAPPPTMDINFWASGTVPSLVIAQVGPNGQVSINNNSAGATQVVADVMGWFPAYTTNYGQNYNWYEVIPQCPGETLTPIIPNYSNTSVVSTVQNQLRTMQLNGVDTIDLLVGLDETYGAGAIYPNIRTEADSLKVQHLNAYFSVINQFAKDAKAAGIPHMFLKIGGWYGACTASNTVDTISLQQGIADGEKIIDAMITQVIRSSGTKPNFRIDLAGEIGPSNYQPQCMIDGMKSYIGAIWSYLVDTYPDQLSAASMSSILDDSTDVEIAGNRLKNLISALAATGRQMPSWFSIHPYDVDSMGAVTTGATLNKLLGAYQIYADFGFLSNQAHPKETVIGEIHTQDIQTANEISSFMTAHNGTKINLTTIIDWPLHPDRTQNPAIDSCTHVANVSPPYKSFVYRNALQNGLTQQQLQSSITASPNPVIVPAGGATGNTTITWNAPAYSQTALWLSYDGGALTPVGASSGSGTAAPSWIQAGHSYTFFIFPFANGNTLSPALDSVTVIGKSP